MLASALPSVSRLDRRSRGGAGGGVCILLVTATAAAWRGLRRDWRRFRLRRRRVAAGRTAVDVVQLGALLDAEEHVDEGRQFSRRRQHGEGVQYVVGLADGGVGRRFAAIRRRGSRSTAATDSLLSDSCLP